MKHRDRVLTTIEHREPDRVPFDYAEGMTRPLLGKMKAKLGTDDQNKIMKILDVDFEEHTI